MYLLLVLHPSMLEPEKCPSEVNFWCSSMLDARFFNARCKRAFENRQIFDKNSAFSVKYPGKSSIMQNFLMLEDARAQNFIFEHAGARLMLEFFILDATLFLTNLDCAAKIEEETPLFYIYQMYPPWNIAMAECIIARWNWTHTNTDPGTLIWNFDCGYSNSTVWKFSNFPATPVFREINFGWFQKAKNCHFNNFGGFVILIFGKILSQVYSLHSLKLFSFTYIADFYNCLVLCYF